MSRLKCSSQTEQIDLWKWLKRDRRSKSNIEMISIDEKDVSQRKWYGRDVTLTAINKLSVRLIFEACDAQRTQNFIHKNTHTLCAGLWRKMSRKLLNQCAAKRNCIKCASSWEDEDRANEIMCSIMLEFWHHTRAFWSHFRLEGANRLPNENQIYMVKEWESTDIADNSNNTKIRSLTRFMTKPLKGSRKKTWKFGWSFK